MTRHQLLIGGKLVDGAMTMDVVNPATGQPFLAVARASLEQFEAAIAAAKAAFPAWARTPIEQRRALILKLADAIEQNKAEFARALVQEQGKPMREAEGEVGATLGFLRGQAGFDLDVEILRDDSDRYIEVQRRPLGVVAGIIPWNFPLAIIAFKLPCALLAGNTMIVKPAATTPVTALMLGALAKDIFPAGVVNVVTDANDLGDVLTNHQDVAKISFTGSTATGKKVASAAAATLKRITLELGGNDAAIVLDDVDVKETAAKIFNGAFSNCGQICIAIKRAYVPRGIYDQMCDELAGLANRAVVDDGMRQGATLGPLQNRMQYDKVQGFLDDAHQKGKVIAGGKRIDRPGYFIEPTIVRDVHDGDRIVDEEQFGPILPVVAYDDVDAVVKQVNASPYGLGGSVWGRDVNRAIAVANQVETGTIWVNQHFDVGPDIPFGGARNSGVGVEFTKEGLEEFTQIRVLNVAR